MPETWKAVNPEVFVMCSLLCVIFYLIAICFVAGLPIVHQSVSLGHFIRGTFKLRGKSVAGAGGRPAPVSGAGPVKVTGRWRPLWREFSGWRRAPRA